MNQAGASKKRTFRIMLSRLVRKKSDEEYIWRERKRREIKEVLAESPEKEVEKALDKEIATIKSRILY